MTNLPPRTMLSEATHKETSLVRREDRKRVPRVLEKLRKLINNHRYSRQFPYTMLCRQVGRCLIGENLQAGRGAHGKQILATTSRELTAESEKAFTLRPLYRVSQFRSGLTGQEIVSTLSTQSSCSHPAALQSGRLR